MKYFILVQEMLPGIEVGVIFVYTDTLHLTTYY